ncbi:MAG: NB-ARC domain-containing protein [Eubacteriales bacterium]
MNESIITKKSEMYEMIIALEADFIENFHNKLKLEDIPKSVIQSSKLTNDRDPFLSVLRGLDFQAYIEICNANIEKLNFGVIQKDFINKDFIKIIPIRNNVMHPRPLALYDYPILKETFNQIDKILSSMTWTNVLLTRRKIAEHPEELISPPINLKKSDRIIENLPAIVDYEETSFIGRRREIGEIKAKLNKNNVHILSIIGDGGIGKTAIVLKLLYDLLDEENCKWELILWTSLKTSELNNYEFSEIKNSLKNTSAMYNQLASVVGADSSKNVEEYIIELAKNFNTLFVLDNLETINTSEIKDFLEEFAEYGKVLITSRIGLGEMEHRYKLGGLDNTDVMEYTDTLLSLYGFEGMFSNTEKYDIAVKQLHSNPLAIKWFVRCLYNGQTVDNVLAHKEDIINFCMSNVYEKLSDKAHEVLNIMVVAGVDLSYAELMYYLDCNLDDYTDISYALNDLIKCNFIDDVIFRTEKKVSITSFAKEFLKLNFVDTKQLVSKFKEKEKVILTFHQQVLQSKHKSPYAMKSFSFHNNDKSRIIAAFYLMKAIQCSNKDNMDEAFKLVSFAKKLAPNYFECNKVAAFLYGTTSPLKAREEYDIAKEYCETDEEKATILVVYAGFLLRCNDYHTAISELSVAQALQPDNIYIKLERIKILGCINDFKEAYSLLDSIDYELLDNHYKNIYLTRKADLLKRQSELFDQRDIKKKFELIKNAFCTLEESQEPDEQIYDYMVYLLSNLSYIIFDESVMSFIKEKIEKYFTFFRKCRRFKELKKNIIAKLDGINETPLKTEIEKYFREFDDLLPKLKSNQGVVYALKYEQGFGFFKTKDYPKGVYFRINYNIREIQIGDIIEFDEIITTSKGVMVRNIKIVSTTN